MELILAILFTMVLVLMYCLYLMYINYKDLFERQNVLAEIVFNLLEDENEDNQIISTMEKENK